MPTETPNLPEQLHQRPGTDVATRTNGPDGPGLDAGDILIPRMKLAQMISRVVAETDVAYGDVYIVQSREDMDPIILSKAPTRGELGKAVRFYIHGDPRKGWSWKPAVEGGEWRGQEYPSLALVAGSDPRNVRRTYDYLVTVPEFPMLPVRFLMHGAWGGQAAKQINTQLLLSRQQGIESHTLAFKLQVKKTSNNKSGTEQNYVQAIVGLDKVAAKDKKADLELVEQHRSLVGQGVRELDDSDTERSTASAPVDAPDLDAPDLG